MDRLQGETQMSKMKKIKGMVRFVEDDSYDGEQTNSPYLAAKHNPDLLSDENLPYPERDFDQEQERAEFVAKYAKALEKLTPRQRAVIEALDRLGDQKRVADELEIDRVTVAVTLRKIQKKILKAVNKMQKGQL